MASLLDGSRPMRAGRMKLAQPMGVLIGVGMMAAPAIFDYAGTAASDFHRVVGPLAACFATIAWWEATSAVRWPNTVLGAALLLGPLVVHHRGPALAVAVISGGVLAAATPFGGSRQHQLGGGWLALADKDVPATERRQTP